MTAPHLDASAPRNDSEESGATHAPPIKEKPLTWVLLAARFGVSVQAINGWRVRPGAPETTNLQEWEAFVKEQGLGLKKESALSESKQEKLKLEAQLLRAKLAKEQRRVLDREEVSRLFLRIATEQRAILYQFAETEAPPKLDGMTAAQMRPILREFADSICDRMGPLVDQLLNEG